MQRCGGRFLSTASATVVSLIAVAAHARIEVVEDLGTLESMMPSEGHIDYGETSHLDDINRKHHDVMVDEDGEMIEDLSEDFALDAAEEDEFVGSALGTLLRPGNMQPAGSPMGGLFGFDDDDDELDDGYVEESMDKDGNTMRKEVHSGPGWTSVSYSSSGGVRGPGGPSPIDDIMDGMLAAIMQQQLGSFGAGPGPMAQRRAAPPFMDFYELDDGYDEEDEEDLHGGVDPFAEIFQEMEASRRQNQEMRFGAPVFVPFFDMPVIEIELVPDDHAMVAEPYEITVI